MPGPRARSRHLAAWASGALHTCTLVGAAALVLAALAVLLIEHGPRGAGSEIARRSASVRAAARSS